MVDYIPSLFLVHSTMSLVTISCMIFLQILNHSMHIRLQPSVCAADNSPFNVFTVPDSPTISMVIIMKDYSLLLSFSIPRLLS